MTDQKYEGKDLEAMSFAVNYHRWILKEFSPCLSGTVAEVGAGTGSFTKEILAMKNSAVTQIHAFEPSRDMFERLEQNVAGTIARPFNEFFSDKTGGGTILCCTSM